MLYTYIWNIFMSVLSFHRLKRWIKKRTLFNVQIPSEDLLPSPLLPQGQEILWLYNNISLLTDQNVYHKKRSPILKTKFQQKHNIFYLSPSLPIGRFYQYTFLYFTHAAPAAKNTLPAIIAAVMRSGSASIVNVCCGKMEIAENICNPSNKFR